MVWLIPGFALSAGANDRPGKAPLKLGVCDWTIQEAGDPAALETAARLGLDGVQASFLIKGDTLALADTALQETYLQAVKKHGAQIASFAIGELNNVPLKSDPRAEKWLEQGIGVAASMGVKIVLVPFFGKGDLRNDPAGIEAVVAKLGRLCPKAEKAGVILALESWLSADAHMDILRRVGSPSLRIYYDVGNSQEAGHPVLKEIRMLGNLICQIHAKDYKDLYGKGSMNFPEVRRALDDIGYTGWLVMEGIHLPLGVEKSVLYDAEYLRTVFSVKN